MNTFSLLFQVVIAFVAVNCQQNCLQQQLSGVNIGQFDQQLLDSQSNSGASASASANAAANSGNSLFSNNGLATGPGGLIGPVSGPSGLIGPVSGPSGLIGPASGPNGLVGQISGPINAPYNGIAYNNFVPADPRSPNTQVSESFHSNKGEILIHRPAPIIVKRPPTKVLVNHPPIVVKPAPVVLHKPPPVIMRKVFVKQHPRPVKVEPVYVNVVKPPAEKYFVNEKSAQGAGAVGYNQGQSYLQGPSAAQLQGAGQFSTGPAQFASGPAQFASGPAQLATGPAQFAAGPAQFAAGPAQFATGPGQFAFPGQSQSQSGAAASASAHADSASNNQQYTSQIQPSGCY